jgi:CRISPR/Cas system-associated exonuclease Cas4 (RecB family)
MGHSSPRLSASPHTLTSERTRVSWLFLEQFLEQLHLLFLFPKPGPPGACPSRCLFYGPCEALVF